MYTIRSSSATLIAYASCNMQDHTLSDVERPLVYSPDETAASQFFMCPIQRCIPNAILCLLSKVYRLKRSYRLF